VSETIHTVAVFNASEDTVDMLCGCLSLKGYRCINAHVAKVKRGEVDFIEFIQREQPRAIIWDISPPYDQNWAFFKLLRSSDAVRGIGIVVTTTHKLHLDKLAGQDTGAIEIVGKPFDLDRVTTAIDQAIAANGN
jgi:DNA-binding response OmpR family regulator